GAAQLRGGIRLVEVHGNVGNFGFESMSVAVNGKNVAAHGAEPGGHAAGASSKIHGPETGTSVRPQHHVAHELMKTAIRGGVGHRGHLPSRIAQRMTPLLVRRGWSQLLTFCISLGMRMRRSRSEEH